MAASLIHCRRLMDTRISPCYKLCVNHRRKFLLLVVVVILIFAFAFPALPQRAKLQKGKPSAATSANQREDAYRANNLGVALLEQFKPKEAMAKFRRALELAPSLAIARVNLSIALFYAAELDEALSEARKAAAVLPEAPQPFYMLGLIAKSQNRSEDAMAAFRRVLQIAPRDVGANVYLAQFLMLQRKYDEALKLLRVALEVEPYNATATYNLTISLLRSGQNEEGQQQMKRFQYLRDNYGTSLGQNYLEQGQYAEAIASTGAEPDLVDAATPNVSFADATTKVMPTDEKSPPLINTSPSVTVANVKAATKRDTLAKFSGDVTLFDFDGDGDLDLFAVSSASQKLYRNDNGQFVDVTEAAGLAKVEANAIGIRAVAGDYDNDGKPDLLVLRYGACALYHNDGNGKFSDATATAEIPNYAYLAQAVALVDVDHDGDLDIFIAGFADLTKVKSADQAKASLVIPDDFANAPNLLLRNNGNGKFTDISKTANVATANGHAIAIVPTDFNNRRDVDLLVVNQDAAPTLFSNLRDYTFRDVAADVGLNLAGRITCVAAGDFNKDSFTDFFFGTAQGAGIFAVSDGKSRYAMVAAPAATESAQAAQFVDYDNDGLLDLAIFTTRGLRVFRNLGNKWTDVSDRAIARDAIATSSTPRAVVAGDVDSDGDTDFMIRGASGELKFIRNNGGNRNSSLRVQLAGRISNRSGIGCKLEMRAGSLSQKLETYSTSPAPCPSDNLFGLGKRPSVDAVRVLWPSGNLQAEVDLAPLATPRSPEARKNAPLAQSIKIEEVDRKPSSCPYLYTWNGERFEFVTDFMGGGEMGYWESPTARNHPDPDEYVRIPEGKLKPRHGRYELRVTNELEEVLYVDRFQLVAVAHPADVEVYPNEGMVNPPLPPFKLYKTRHAHLPVSAFDDKGNDVLDRLAKLDRRYPDDFQLHHIRGYAEEHTLTLDLGKPGDGQTLLLMTAWTDYAFSSDNVAASQSGLSMTPPYLQVKDAQGNWQTVIADMGIPVGRPQTVTVDLTGKFLTDNREVRIVTNMRIYWDQILVDTSSGDFPAQITRLNPLTAELHWRGFSKEVTPDGREPFGYDYDKVSVVSPWKTFAGRYTREGEVRELVNQTDDMFVVSRPGDEIAVSFDAKRLPPLPTGWKRTFLFYADGFSKEMDINSASPDQVEPLPFHGMSGYPYPVSESYPMTAARRNYLKRYNTRVVRSQLSCLEAAFAEETRTTHRPANGSRKKPDK
ncbi:MAG: VCBS repeat-containing protein [Acidobacteria bacterium]|nr:VCBS repeat-containing protein [Acidobacteriota bacterium]